LPTEKATIDGYEVESDPFLEEATTVLNDRAVSASSRKGSSSLVMGYFLC
jgi:hypothetical protein